MYVKMISFTIASLLTFASYATEADAADLLVSHDGGLFRYSLSGELLDYRSLPYHHERRDRDVVRINADEIAVFRGRLDPAVHILRDGQWQQFMLSNYGMVNRKSYGGMAVHGGQLVLTDMPIDLHEPSLEGIALFEPTTGTYERHLASHQYIDITVGLDGLLYALGDQYGTLHVIDPNFMTLVREIELGSWSDSMAATADAEGNIFMASLNGRVIKYDPMGTELARLELGSWSEPADIDIHEDGTIAISGFGKWVFTTDTDLSYLDSFPVGWGRTYVAFDAMPNGSGDRYCVARGSDTEYGWITGVAVNGDWRWTGDDGGYANYVDQPPFALTAGLNHISLAQGTQPTHGGYPHWAVGLDFDSDGEFDSVQHGVGSWVELPIHVAPSQVESPVRLRVVMRHDVDAAVCGEFVSGEVEEYSVLLPQE